LKIQPSKNVFFRLHLGKRGGSGGASNTQQLAKDHEHQGGSGACSPVKCLKFASSKIKFDAPWLG